MNMRSINPYSGDVIAEHPPHTPAQIEQILSQTKAASHSWRHTSRESRIALTLKLAEALQTHKEMLATLATNEMGKRIAEARAEIDKCSWMCREIARIAPDALADIPVQTEAKNSLICFRPLGTVLLVMPWNFPFWQALRAAIPALLSGNTILLKHASNVSLCALEIEKLFQIAGFPAHVFHTLLIPGNQVSPLIADPRIHAVSLTGSVTAGRAVAAAAGAALKKCVLELGGSDPYLILEDADIGKAAELCVTSRMLNNGQSCVAAKRFIAVDSVYADFEKAVAAAMQRYTTGNPMDEKTTLGPMASGALRDELHAQVQSAITAGADCILGGKAPSNKAAFYPATILRNVTPENPIYHQELFGPVVVLHRAKDAQEALRIANDSPFGLGSAIFSRNTGAALTLAKDQMETGLCFINDFVKSDPRLPFGGIKDSGYGRELSAFGIREFTNVKTIQVAN